MYIYKYIYTCQIKEATFGGYCPFHILKKVALFPFHILKNRCSISHPEEPCAFSMYIHVNLTVFIYTYSKRLCVYIHTSIYTSTYGGNILRMLSHLTS